MTMVSIAFSTFVSKLATGCFLNLLVHSGRKFTAPKFKVLLLPYIQPSFIKHNKDSSHFQKDGKTAVHIPNTMKE